MGEERQQRLDPVKDECPVIRMSVLEPAKRGNDALKDDLASLPCHLFPSWVDS